MELDTLTSKIEQQVNELKQDMERIDGMIQSQYPIDKDYYDAIQVADMITDISIETRKILKNRLEQLTNLLIKDNK